VPELPKRFFVGRSKARPHQGTRGGGPGTGLKGATTWEQKNPNKFTEGDGKCENSPRLLRLGSPMAPQTIMEKLCVTNSWGPHLKRKFL